MKRATFGVGVGDVVGMNDGARVVGGVGFEVANVGEDVVGAWVVGGVGAKVDSTGEEVIGITVGEAPLRERMNASTASGKMDTCILACFMEHTAY